jgi:hypothetical protein
MIRTTLLLALLTTTFTCSSLGAVGSLSLFRCQLELAETQLEFARTFQLYRANSNAWYRVTLCVLVITNAMQTQLALSNSLSSIEGNGKASDHKEFQLLNSRYEDLVKTIRGIKARFPSDGNVNAQGPFVLTRRPPDSGRISGGGSYIGPSGSTNEVMVRPP